MTITPGNRMSMRIAGRTVLDTSLHTPKPGKVNLTAGSPVPVEITYEEDEGEAFVRLFWTPPGGIRSVPEKHTAIKKCFQADAGRLVDAFKTDIVRDNDRCL